MSSYHEGIRRNYRKPALDHADVSEYQAQNALINPSAAVTHPLIMSDQLVDFAAGAGVLS